MYCPSHKVAGLCKPILLHLLRKKVLTSLRMGDVLLREKLTLNIIIKFYRIKMVETGGEKNPQC